MANQFSVQPANFNQGLQGLNQGLLQRNQQQVAQQKMEQQQALMGQYMDAVSQGDIGAQQQFMRNNPIMMEQFAKINSLGDARKDALKNEVASQVLDKNANQMITLFALSNFFLTR